jgi:hypothetical protein
MSWCENTDVIVVGRRSEIIQENVLTGGIDRMNSRNRKRDRGPARKQKPVSESGKISGHFSVVP